MPDKTLAELVEEQNRLATAIAPQRPCVVVRVLVPGRYNGPDLKSVRAKAGEIISVAGNGYADDLIAQGLVEAPVIADDDDENNLTIAELRTMAKQAGINSKGMTKEALRDALFGGGNNESAP